MNWLLIILFAADGQTGEQRAGHMADQNTCLVAGAGIELILEAANPGVDVAFLCLPMNLEAGS